MKDSATISPVRYYDPKTEKIEPPPRQQKVRTFDYPDVQNPTTPHVIDKTGLFFTRTQPADTVRWHLTDGIYFTVRAVGTYDKIVDWKGEHIGYWKEKVVANNTEIHSGVIRAFGQEITFVHKHGNKNGKDVFTLYPASIFAVKTLDDEDMLPRFIDRALFIAAILRNTGWQLTEPTFNGKVHVAKKDRHLIQHMEKGYNPDGADLVTDTSDGNEAEVEMENLTGDPLAKAKLDYMAHLPTRGLAAEAKIDSLEAKMNRLIGVMGTMGIAHEKIIEIVAAILESNAKNVEILSEQEKASIIQTRINNNIIASIMAGNQTTIENYNKKKSEEEQKQQSDDYLEAYQ